MNSVLIVGNVVRDAEIKSIGNGKTVARFTVACNRSYIDANGEKKQLADFVSVVAWGNLAEQTNGNLFKGVRVMVQGRYSTRNWQTQTGEKRYTTEVIAEEIAKTLYQPSTTQGKGNFEQFGRPHGQPQQTASQQENFDGFRRDNTPLDEQIPF